MPKTGWIGEDEQDQGGQDQGGQALAMPASAFILGNRPAPGQGKTLQQALERTAAVADRRDPEVTDPDERVAGMLSRGYQPGAVSQLSLRLGDVCVELQAEQEKLEQGARRAEQVRQMHQRGQIRALDIPQMLGDDLGDEGRVRQLERQAASLRQQLDEAHQAMSPPQPQQLDGVEAASRRAHEVFREVTRARMAEAEARPARRPASRPAPRPFAGRGAVAVRSEHCIHCIDAGATDEESYLLHSDPEYGIPVTPPDTAEQAGYRSSGGRVPVIYR